MNENLFQANLSKLWVYRTFLRNECRYEASDLYGGYLGPVRGENPFLLMNPRSPPSPRAPISTPVVSPPLSYSIFPPILPPSAPALFPSAPVPQNPLSPPSTPLDDACTDEFPFR
eukprot:6206057-Pleurochrysis_carterae.AAC.1